MNKQTTSHSAMAADSIEARQVELEQVFPIAVRTRGLSQYAMLGKNLIAIILLSQLLLQSKWSLYTLRRGIIWPCSPRRSVFMCMLANLSEWSKVVIYKRQKTRDGTHTDALSITYRHVPF